MDGWSNRREGLREEAPEGLVEQLLRKRLEGLHAPQGLKRERLAVGEQLAKEQLLWEFGQTDR